MELNGSHRKWSTSGRRCARMESALILCTTMCVFSLMMLLKVEVYRGGAGSWSESDPPRIIKQMAMPAMKTIIAYSPEKQEEMQRKRPIVCDGGRVERYARSSTKDSRWQAVEGGGVSVYSAYYDERVSSRPYVRVLAVTNGAASARDVGPLYCQTWSKNSEEHVDSVEATVTPIWWKQWDPGSRDAVTPLLISCNLVDTKREPFFVSVSSDACEEASNVLKVEPSTVEEYSRNFTVCVKDMNFTYDISNRLIEWFELLKLLGADRVDVYVAKVPKKVHKVLQFYAKNKFVTVRPAPRPPSETLWQRRRDHLLAYNDCLYRNLRQSRYIVPLDVDEVIVPRGDETWPKLMTELESLESGAASLAVSNAFFFDSFGDEYDDNKLPHTLRHLRRSSLISPAPQYSKSFVSTSKALTVFNHYALGALAGAERARAVPQDKALLHHYKKACRPALVDCHQYTVGTVRDETLLRLASSLITNVNKVLDSI